MTTIVHRVTENAPSVSPVISSIGADVYFAETAFSRFASEWVADRIKAVFASPSRMHGRSSYRLLLALAVAIVLAPDAPQSALQAQAEATNGATDTQFGSLPAQSIDTTPASTAATQNDSAVPADQWVHVSIGASFDFLNQVTASDIYGDVDVYLPNLWWDWVGIEAGLFNGRATSRTDTVPRVRSFVGLPYGTDSTAVIEQSFSRVEGSYEDRLGIHLGVLAQIKPSLFLTIHGEILQRNWTISTADTLSQTDTLGLVASDGDTNVPGLPEGVRLGSRLIEDQQQTAHGTFYQSQYSIGFLVRHTQSGVGVMLKPLIGYGSVAGDRVWLYSVNFGVTDLVHGFKLGGDVRGHVGSDDNIFLSVHLAKSFSLKKLGSFLGTGS